MKSKRKHVSAPHWDLTEIYLSPKDPKIQKDLNFVKKQTAVFAKKYRNKVAKLSLDQLLKALKEYEKIYTKVYLLSCYPEFAFTVNTKDPEVLGLMQRVELSISEIQNETIFFALDLAKHPKLSSFIEDKKASEFRFFFQKMLNDHKHHLPEDHEKLLNTKSIVARSGWTKLFVKTDAEIQVNYKGQKMSREQALKYLHSPKRKVRQETSRAFSEQLRESLPIFAHIYNMLLLDKMQDDKLRKYPNPEQGRHDTNGVSKKAVDALFETAKKNSALVSRYYKAKQKALGLKDFYTYDRFAPLNAKGKQYTFKEAASMVSAAFRKFDPRFDQIFQQLLKAKHIDAQTAEGKRGGAFCAGMPTGFLPYIMMNFVGESRDVQTLAHETGHAIQDIFTSKHSIIVAHPPLTLAETASVFAEMIMFEHLAGQPASKKEKAAIYSEKIDDIFSTIFRQLFFFSFERKAHAAIKEKGEVSAEELNGFWLQAHKEFYGNSYKVEDGYGAWWSYVLHFYEYPFYVYAYAFGNILVFALWQEYKTAVKSGDARKVQAFKERYIKLLSMGGTRSTSETLKELGYDTEDSRFWQKGFDALAGLIGDFEKMC